MGTQYQIEVDVKKISVQSKGIGSNWHFRFNVDNQTSEFSRKISPGKSTNPKLTAYSSVIFGDKDTPLALPLSLNIVEKDPVFDDNASVVAELNIPLEEGNHSQVVYAQVNASGGDKGAQALIAFEFCSSVKCQEEALDDGEKSFDPFIDNGNDYEIGDTPTAKKPKRPPVVYTETFNEAAPCPTIKVKWSSGLPVINGRLVPIPINAANHNRKAKLVISTKPKTKVTLKVVPAKAGSLNKKVINGSGEVLFTAGKNTSGFAIMMLVNGRVCGAVFGQNFTFTEDVVPLGGTSDNQQPFTAGGGPAIIDLKGFLGNNTPLKTDSATRTITGRIDVDTSPKNFYFGSVTADVALTAKASVSLFTNGLLGGTITVGGKQLTFAALSSKAAFAGSVQLTGVAGSTPTSFAGYKADAPDISLANPGKAIADTGGTPASQTAKTGTGKGSPASFPTNQKSPIGYSLSGTISGSKDRITVPGVGTIVEATSKSSAAVDINKVSVSGYKIGIKLPAFTKP